MGLLDRLSRVYASLRIGFDSRTPRYLAVISLFATGYVIFPGDFDWVPVIGWVDDATVVAVSHITISRVAPADVVAEQRRKAANHVPLVIAGLCSLLLLFLSMVLGVFDLV
jgi:uncharacterized membrane protein YkvA (DUF1232 family)